MRVEDEARLLPEIREGLRELRASLGLRPTTRLDVVVFRDGSCFRQVANGTFVAVRGALGWPGPRGE